jgi:hypothetical protein
MADFKSAYESYFTSHPGAIETLRKEKQNLNLLKVENIRAVWAKPLIRIESFPLKLRDLEK